MKLTDYVAIKLQKYVEHIFVGNGGCVIHLLDSLAKTHKLIPTENEQAAAIAAEAYSRMRGFGVAVATSGPGFVNLIQGIASAYYDSIPVLFIVGADPVKCLKTTSALRQRGFQEMPVQHMSQHITKRSIILKDPRLIDCALDELIYWATEGRPGPVLLELPDDIQRVDIGADIDLTKFPICVSKSINDLEYEIIDDVVYDIRYKYKRPLIIIGGGCRNARLKVYELLKHGIPYVTTWASKDMFNHISTYLVGGFGVSDNVPGNWAVQHADYILVLGCKLDFHQTGVDQSNFASKAKIVQVDIDPREFGRGIITKQVKCDVGYFLKELNKKLEEHFPLMFWVNWYKEIEKVVVQYPISHSALKKYNGFVNPYAFMDELSKHTAENAIIIPDAGANLTWTMQGYPIRRAQRLFSSFNHSPMGYAICAAIGAQVACPDKQVVCIIGDGGLQMNIQELATIVHHKLPIKIFVMHNNGYGIMRQTQDTWLEGRHTAIDPESGVGIPNFLEIANAYEINYFPIITNQRYMENTIKRVLASEHSVLCVVEIAPNARITPKVESGHTIDDMTFYE